MKKLSIADCITLSAQLASVSDTARLDIELLLCHILQKSRTYLFTWPEYVLTHDQEKLFNDYFARRLIGEPVAHITGVREFWSLPLFVNNSTLIPRPDTELLVETTLELFANDEPNSRRHLLDLGTGTGAIALALAAEKKHWNCVGVDREIAAVELAEKNRKHLLSTNSQFFQSDWFSNIPAANQFDIIVSNPPYIDPCDSHLDSGDVRFEPRSALVADKNGRADLECIIREAKDYLFKNGWLIVEHGYDQGEVVRHFFTQHAYGQVQTRRDIGNNERITFGQKN